MKILIAYYSETGNTEQVAQAMYEAVAGEHDVVLIPVAEVVVERLSEYELVLLGAAVHDSDLARPLKRLLDALSMNPGFKLAGFSTHAVYLPDGSAHRDELYARWAGKWLSSFENTCREKGIQFLGYFHCQGVASKPIERFIHREIITSEEEWKEYLPELQKHPTPEDLQNAKDFARRIIDNM
jgi:flavodoxin